jgi:ribosomal protein S18 acetylase RimI-like enzyme
LSLAVDPAFRSEGLGSLLIQKFLEFAESKGSSKVILSTDGEKNEAINRFYIGLGFMLERQYVTPWGRQMNEYLIATNKWHELKKTNQKKW